MTRPSRRTLGTRRTAVVGVAACLAVVGLTGCSGDRLGAAAVIDGTSVSTKELQRSTQAYLDVVPQGDAGDAQLAILQRKVVSAVIDSVAEDKGVRVREGQVAQERDELLQSVGGRKGLVRALAQSQNPTVLPPAEIDRWVKDRLLFNEIASQICGCQLDPTAEETQQALSEANDALREKSSSMDIEISPRYGEWDPDQGISPLVSGGLSKSVDELRADGS